MGRPYGLLRAGFPFQQDPKHAAYDKLSDRHRSRERGDVYISCAGATARR